MHRSMHVFYASLKTASCRSQTSSSGHGNGKKHGIYTGRPRARNAGRLSISAVPGSEDQEKHTTGAQKELGLMARINVR